MARGEQTTSGLSEWAAMTPRSSLPPPQPPSGGRTHRVHLLLRVLGVALLAVGCGVLGFLVWQNYQRAEEWRASYGALQQDHDAALAANEDLSDVNDELSASVEELSSTLEASEADVARLEQRVSDLAHEKAVVEDEREFIATYAERLAEVSVAYDELAGLFSTCVREQETFTDMMVNFDLYWNTGTTYVVSEQATRTGEVCGSAQGYLIELRRYVDALYALLP
jgi:hypothetical protein